jgi:ATP-dependent DNA helicase PIF1
MRLQSPLLSDTQRDHLKEFSKWLLHIGEGTLPDNSPTDRHDTCYIKIPGYLLLPPESRNISSLVSFVYNESSISDMVAYFCERAILAPTNDIAAEINSHMISQLPTEQMSYYSSDIIDDSTANRATLEAFYPVEFLNTI